MASQTLIAKTTFETGADNKVAVVDVYKEANTAPLNAVQGPSLTTENKISTDPEKLKPLTPEKPSLSKKFKELRKKVKPYREAYKAIRKGYKDPAMLSDALNKHLLPDLLKAHGLQNYQGVIIEGIRDKDSLKHTLGELHPELKVAVDGVETLMKVKDKDSVAGVLEVLSDLTGNNDLIKTFDLGDEFTAIKAGIDFLNKNRIPKLADKLIQKRRDKKEARRLTLLGIESAARHSELDFIRGALDDKNVGIHRVKSMYPNLLKDILNNYILPLGKNSITAETAKELVDLLFKIDPKWLEYNRNGKKISNLSILMDASPAAIESLILDKRTRTEAIIAADYKSIDSIRDTLARRPYAPTLEKLEEIDRLKSIRA